MEACAKNHVPLHLELGGKSPQIVLRDANLGRAVPNIVRFLIQNSGQVCYAGTRLLVEEPLRKELVSAISTAFQGVRVGRWDEEADMGPLINAKQQERVLGYLETGQDEGARLAVGGHKMTDEKFARGFFVEPSLFDEVKPEMRIAQEEIFGPVLSVIGFKDPDEALAIANGTPYGLMASVWTDNLQRAVALARGLEAGQVYVNTYFSRDAIGAPFGGYKRSGFGRTQGYETILDYTQLKTVIINAEA
jgi:acyl-CoA reductase-like NAD-dependent aldehyde dehydrogenase